MPTPLDSLNAQVFREQLHSQFKIHDDNSATLELELVEIIESNQSPKMELFSLHFRGPFRPLLNQRTYRLEHEKLGDFEILLTPISADEQNGAVYEAVFHRFRKPSA